MILYKFYFHNYHYRRIVKGGWAADPSDIILTYDPMKYSDIGIEVAREARSALYLLKKKSGLSAKAWEASFTSGVILKNGTNDSVVERLTCEASELIAMSNVGEFVGGRLLSSNKTGYLFFGPYIKLDKGEYKITIYGEFNEPSSATLDIVAGGGSGRQFFSKVNLSDLEVSSGALSLDFYLPQDISNLEIRLHVTDKDHVAFDKYVIEKSAVVF